MSVWCVLLDDGQWYPIRGRRPNEAIGAHWTQVEADVSAWLEQHAATGSAQPLLSADGARYEPPMRDGSVKVRALAFESGYQALDFVRRLNVLFDGRTSRLIIPSTPVVIYGPALIHSERPVTLYAGRGAVALARYVGV